jgi:hypothetical protein
MYAYLHICISACLHLQRQPPSISTSASIARAKFSCRVAPSSSTAAVLQRPFPASPVGLGHPRSTTPSAKHLRRRCLQTTSSRRDRNGDLDHRSPPALESSLSAAPCPLLPTCAAPAVVVARRRLLSPVHPLVSTSLTRKNSSPTLRRHSTPPHRTAFGTNPYIPSTCATHTRQPFHSAVRRHSSALPDGSEASRALVIWRWQRATIASG